jgi:peptidoglycan hydrolase-like protein with peptidoglycan-binding domain
VTGVAGPATSGFCTAAPPRTGSYTTLDTGSSGTAVKKLQYTLYELKYYDGNITGTYDDATEAAVKLFQEVNRNAAASTALPGR